jgi:hypothetical protein
MGAVKKLNPDYSVISEPSEGATRWKEMRDQELFETQILCSHLEKKFITAVNQERIYLLNLLAIYYTKIQELASNNTGCERVDSVMNYDEFTI